MPHGARIVIASTFTAEPLSLVLEYWLQERGCPAEVTYAPFDQILQTLVDPSSAFFAPGEGLNVAAFRIEDVGRRDSLATLDAIEGAVRELLRAASAVVARSPRPILLVACPPSPSALATPGLAELAARLGAEIAEQCERVAGLFYLGSSEIETHYSFDGLHDEYGDREGRLPYTPLGFTAIATMIARRFDAVRRKSPYKVIAVDCDNTLWNGVVGEDGVEGVVIDEGRRTLQQVLKSQKSDFGMLLCMCSKNNERDVFELFEKRPDMVLAREDFVSWRINWDRKSDNLAALAGELQLGLDSFVFLDDDPVQCAEVRGVCPKVHVIELPRDSSDAARALLDAWELDHAKVTDEDRRRTAFYAENRDRESAKAAYANVEEYLASLELAIAIDPIRDEQVSRVAQLTQRTNQFNCHGIRRTEAELEAFRAGGGQILTVDVKDRFGDYGLVGAVVFEVKSDALEVDSFLLSCRALGRGVEDRVLARLRNEAAARQLDRVDVFFRRTPKNQPAADFLARSNAASSTTRDDGTVVYTFAAREESPR